MGACVHSIVSWWSLCSPMRRYLHRRPIIVSLVVSRIHASVLLRLDAMIVLVLLLMHLLGVDSSNFRGGIVF